jgi:hypothetical protein
MSELKRIEITRECPACSGKATPLKFKLDFKKAAK